MILVCRAFQVCCLAVALLALVAVLLTGVWWLVLVAPVFAALTVPFGDMIADIREDDAREERIRANLERSWTR